MRVPFHTPSHLISIANFDTTSKSELVQIAQHNANILKQYKDNRPSAKYDSFTFMTPILNHNTVPPMHNFDVLPSGSNHEASIRTLSKGYNNLNIHHNAPMPAKVKNNMFQQPSYFLTNYR